MAAPSHVLSPRSAQRFRPPRFGLSCSHLHDPATVDAAYVAGIRFFDAYGDSEARLGEALAERPRGEYLISTKVVGDPAESLRRSRDTLGLAVDLAFATDPHAYPDLDALRQQGVIKAVGAVSDDWAELDHLVRDVALDCVLLTGHYSLLDRSAAPLLDRAQARGVAVIVSSVLTPEVLHPETVQARRLSAVCERYGVSLPQAALAFPTRHPAVTSVLIAAATPAEIRADAALVRQPVPEKLWRDPELNRLLD